MIRFAKRLFTMHSSVLALLILVGGFSANATATPVPDDAVADTAVTIRATPTGEFSFELAGEAGPKQFVEFVNETNVIHHLVITQDGHVTTKVPLGPDNNRLEMRFHQPGPVHVECTDHGTEVTFRVQ